MNKRMREKKGDNQEENKVGGKEEKVNKASGESVIQRFTICFSVFLAVFRSLESQAAI